jgi:hypothetical protein
LCQWVGAMGLVVCHQKWGEQERPWTVDSKKHRKSEKIGILITCPQKREEKNGSQSQTKPSFDKMVQDL